MDDMGMVNYGYGHGFIHTFPNGIANNGGSNRKPHARYGDSLPLHQTLVCDEVWKQIFIFVIFVIWPKRFIFHFLIQN
jgi:hypothetical protein